MKGEHNGICNITRCDNNKDITWFNHSTRKYYCPSCADMLNNDPYNQRDAQRLFGHSLCTHDPEKKIA